METKIQLGQVPWSAEFDQMGGYDCMTAAWRIKDANGRTVAEVDYANWNAEHFDSTPMAEADRIAKLIAAAPELLEICKSILESEGDTSLDTMAILGNRWKADLEAAIAKATGVLR